MYIIVSFVLAVAIIFSVTAVFSQEKAQGIWDFRPALKSAAIGFAIFVLWALFLFFTFSAMV